MIFRAVNRQHHLNLIGYRFGILCFDGGISYENLIIETKKLLEEIWNVPGPAA